MDSREFSNRALKWTQMGALGALTLAVAFGCDKADAQTDPQPEAVRTEGQPAASSAKTSVSAETSDAPGKVAGQAAYNEEAFQLNFEGPSTTKVGAPLSLKVILVAKNGYKVNDEYPIKFKLDESSGVKSAKDTVRKEDAKVEKMRVEMPLQITIGQPGATSVSGRLSFSVCTEERCLIEKRDLKLTVNAS